MNNTHLIIKSDPLEISPHTIVMEIQPEPTFPCATLALPSLWPVVAGYGPKYNNNVTMARVAIINYADEALHHNPIVR